MSAFSSSLSASLSSSLSASRTAPARLAAAVQSRRAAAPDGDRDAGMTTAEYAVGTVAACGFSGVLYKVVTSPSVLELVKAVIGKALKLSF